MYELIIVFVLNDIMSWFIRSVSALPSLSYGITVRCFSFNFFKSPKKLAEKDAKGIYNIIYYLILRNVKSISRSFIKSRIVNY